MFSLRATRSVVSALALVTTGMIAGCGDPGSSRPQSLPALPVVTSQPQSASPPDPSNRLDRPRAEVATVVRRYYAVLNGLHRTMDARGFARIFAPSCPCQAQARAIRHAKSLGEHYIDRVQIVKITPTLDGPRMADVLVRFNASRGGLVNSSGIHVTSAPPASGVERHFILERIGRRWLITRIGVV